MGPGGIDNGFEMMRMAGNLALCDDDYLFQNDNER